jgi:hypothetical protein
MKAQALSVVNVCMAEFTASIIRHNLKGSVVDDKFLDLAKERAIHHAKNMEINPLGKADEAEALGHAVAILDHLIDLAICSGRNLAKDEEKRLW